MAIESYSTLQTAITNWLDRSDTGTTARIPEFIALAEAKFNRKLRLTRMEAITTGTLASDTISFPTDYLAISKVQLNSSATIILEQMSKEALIRKYPLTSTGEPKAFAINGDQIEVKPISDGSYTYELSYYQKIPALTDTNTTNWLLTLYPDAYLYGALLEAAPYLKDKEDLATWAALYTQVITEITTHDNRDKYSGGSLRARAV